MTMEECIKWLKSLKTEIGKSEHRTLWHYAEAIDTAIDALQIDVVLCKECIQKHIGGSVTHYYWCDLWDREVDCNNGCSWGERKGGDDE